MSTHELYTGPVEMQTWDVEAQGAARFTWDVCAAETANVYRALTEPRARLARAG